MRLTVADLAIEIRLKTALMNLCVLLGVREQDVDLLIDYEFKKPDDYEDLIHLQELHFTKIPKIDSWRTITLASVSFPKSIADLPDAKWVKLDRIEWKSWEYMFSSRTASRRPAYGDYGIRHPSLPGFGTPKPNLRYTLAERYLCRRDEAKHAAMKEICKSLVRRSEYIGAPFSEGDKVISETAAIVGSGHSGGGREWTQWCSNHHFEFVATQIQSLPSFLIAARTSAANISIGRIRVISLRSSSTGCLADMCVFPARRRHWMISRFQSISANEYGSRFRFFLGFLSSRMRTESP